MEYQDLSSFIVPESFRGKSKITVQIWWIIQATLFNWSPQVLYGWRAFFFFFFFFFFVYFVFFCFFFFVFFFVFFMFGGKGTIVSARSTVLKDLPAGKICVGTPAKPIKDRPLSK